ncbi:MAG: succinate dehydrogenase, cytochrome b556 subunit [Chloroflexota bacterium]
MTGNEQHNTALRWGDTVRWFDARRRGLGMWAFALNRITGVLLMIYILVHFVNISVLYLGETAWNQLMDLFRRPPFLIFDVALVLVLLYHGLNGIRLAILALDIGVAQQKRIFWGLMAFGTIVAVFTAFGLFRG